MLAQTAPDTQTANLSAIVANKRDGSFTAIYRGSQAVTRTVAMNGTTAAGHRSRIQVLRSGPVAQQVASSQVISKAHARELVELGQLYGQIDRWEMQDEMTYVVWFK